MASPTSPSQVTHVQSLLASLVSTSFDERLDAATQMVALVDAAFVRCAPPFDCIPHPRRPH